VAYWDGAPKVKRLVIRPVPEVAARIAELQTGNADIVTSIPPFLVSQVKNLRNATVQTIPSGRAIFLYINSLGDGPLKNKKVRQALNYAVDRKVIVENILLGSGIVTAINITPYHFGYDPSLKPYPYDPGKAKELLAEAGYATGLKIEFCTPTGRYQLDKEVSEAIAGMFNKVGIQTEFKVVEWATYLQTLTGGKLKDVGFIGFANALHDVDGTFTPFFTKTPFSYYHTPGLAEKIGAARTMLDEKKRLELYKEIQREIYEEAPVVFLYQQVDHYGVSRTLNGFQVRGDEQLVLYQVSK
jgi:peptide/nickel transport system substrate-binding protein